MPPANAHQAITPKPASTNLAATDLPAGALVAIVLPFVLVVSMIAHRKHRVRKLRQQVALLERLWLINSSTENQR
jgi:hypothetical protein